jgi:hypothetical protein
MKEQSSDIFLSMDMQVIAACPLSLCDNFHTEREGQTSANPVFVEREREREREQNRTR